MSFETVEKFEKSIARFYGAPFAVAVDCCTHAVELCLIHTKANDVVCPAHTYISIPFTLTKLGLNWRFEDQKWKNYYTLGNTNIIDGAVHFVEGGYIPGSLMCLSFQFKKPLNLGRGGAVLCEKFSDYIALKKLSYDGRYGDKYWGDQQVDTVGYHYYMTPETALMGLTKLPVVSNKSWPEWSWENYPYLPDMPVFKEKA